MDTAALDQAQKVVVRLTSERDLYHLALVTLAKEAGALLNSYADDASMGTEHESELDAINSSVRTVVGGAASPGYANLMVPELVGRMRQWRVTGWAEVAVRVPYSVAVTALSREDAWDECEPDGEDLQWDAVDPESDYERIERYEHEDVEVEVRI